MNSHQIESYVDVTAAAIGLPLDAQHRPGVLPMQSTSSDCPSR